MSEYSVEIIDIRLRDGEVICVTDMTILSAAYVPGDQCPPSVAESQERTKRCYSVIMNSEQSNTVLFQYPHRLLTTHRHIVLEMSLAKTGDRILYTTFTMRSSWTKLGSCMSL